MKLCLFVGSQNKAKQSQFEGERPSARADGTFATRSKGIAIWGRSGYIGTVMNGISMKGTD